MADGTTFIRIPQSGGAPEDYLVSGASSIGLLAAKADFDGSGAGGDFLPALQVLDETGQVVATVFGSPVTAGDSASVTFAPFLGDNTGGSGAGGIDFNKVNDRAADGTIANYLDIQLSGDGNGPGTELSPAALSVVNSTTSGAMELVNANDQPQGVFQEGAGGQLIRNDGAGDTVISNNGGGKMIARASNGETHVGTSGGGKNLLFFVKDGDVHWLQGGESGTPIMALIWGGSFYNLHIQTGATVIADL